MVSTAVDEGTDVADTRAGRDPAVQPDHSGRTVE
jgi:hypothetical protein